MRSPSARHHPHAFMPGGPPSLASLREQQSKPCWLSSVEFFTWMNNIDTDQETAAPPTMPPNHPSNADISPILPMDTVSSTMSRLRFDDDASWEDASEGEDTSDPVSYKTSSHENPTTSISPSQSESTPKTSVPASTKPCSNTSRRSQRLANQPSVTYKPSPSVKSFRSAPSSMGTRSRTSKISKVSNHERGGMRKAAKCCSDTDIKVSADKMLVVPQAKHKVTCIADLKHLPRGPDTLEDPPRLTYPKLLHDLYDELEEISFNRSIIPQEAQHCPEVWAHLGINNSTEAEQLKIFSKQPSPLPPQKIQYEITSVMDYRWNHAVQFKLMDQAQKPFPHIAFEGVAQLQPDFKYIPMYGLQETQAKMIDFVFSWHPNAEEDKMMIEALLGTEHRSINHVVSNDPADREWPMVIPVETKRKDGDQNMALAQLTLWSMTYFLRLREGCEKNTVFTFPIPMLMVVGNRWILYFAIDDKDRTKIFEYGDIGHTRRLADAYRLLESLKALLRFVMKTWIPLYRKEVLGRPKA
ncbi:hypothetical protein OPT61_g3170 [Boeremia exigua]|uniref:Uncharacterized protein n=1 Tax=Boeremia exigua TaxID=749465 RepID=A0ACC2IIT2_9PLEO|nr:hypothetical protein OPT61_g3170 [Boeremia exigua]